MREPRLSRPGLLAHCAMSRSAFVRIDLSTLPTRSTNPDSAHPSTRSFSRALGLAHRRGAEGRSQPLEFMANDPCAAATARSRSDRIHRRRQGDPLAVANAFRFDPSVLVRVSRVVMGEVDESALVVPDVLAADSELV